MPVAFTPARANRALPVEVVERSDVLARRAGPDVGLRQRLGFNVLMVCTAGSGSHVADYEAVGLEVGTCLRLHPGQVQRFVTDPPVEASMVLWPGEVDPDVAGGPTWFPGSSATTWQLDEDGLGRVLATIDDLRDEQRRFDGSPQRREVLVALLRTLLARLVAESTDGDDTVGQLPDTYVEFRRHIEEHLHERPSIVDVARDLGYSSRTIDRSCREVAGLTAKQVLDERVALEIRRQLTHTDRPTSSIAAEFTFDDVSNFSRFVKRHLGATPRELRTSG